MTSPSEFLADVRAYCEAATPEAPSWHIKTSEPIDAGIEEGHVPEFPESYTVMDENNHPVALLSMRMSAGGSKENATFIARSRTDLPKLLDMIERLRAALEAAKIRHYECEDYYYSCKALNRIPAKCDCGAQEHNEKIKAALDAEVL